MKPSARIALWLFRVAFRLLLRWSVTGTSNVPARGACVLIANHMDLADPMLLMLAFPRHITFLAKEELFRIPVIGQVMRDGGMFPVARAGSLEQKRDVVRQAEGLLAEGNVLAIFPEGQRSHDGVLQKAKPGAAVLALHAGAPLVPVAIVGTEQLKKRGWFLHRPRVTVTIGAPFYLHSTGARLSRSESAAHTEELMHRLAALLPPDRRGYYAD